MVRIKSKSIKIEQINIYLDTSIPSAPRGGADAPAAAPAAPASQEPEKKMIKLESKLLYHPKLTEKAGLNDVPFIISSMKYPIRYLRGILQDDADTNLFDYNKVVRFFFNRAFFQKQMDLFSKEVAAKPKPSDDEKANQEKKEILNFNVKYMLQLLFPTKFPTSNNFSFSFDEYIEQTSVPTSYTVPIDYSYLKMNDKVYTIIKVTVLNDVVNNPLYREIINLYNDFTFKSEQASKLNEEEIKKLKDLIQNKMDNVNKNDSDYYNLKNIFKNFTISNKLFKDLLGGKVVEKKVPQLTELEIRTIKEALDGGNETDPEKIKNLIDEVTIKKEFIKIKKEQEMNNYDVKTGSSALTIRTSLESAYDNYEIIYNNIEEIYGLMEKNKNQVLPSFANDMQKITELLEGIKKSIGIISKVESVTNESTITKVVDKLLEEFTKLKELININKTIQTNKINLDSESAATKEALAKKNPIFAKFVDKIKEIITNHKTNNEPLLKMMKDFYSSKKDTETQVFKDLNTHIITELLNNESRVFFEKKANRDKIQTGIHYINMTEDSKPQYEIYVAVDLFEGEVNDANVKTCNYRAYYLGQEFENMVDRFDYKYDIHLHRLFIPEVAANIPLPLQGPGKKKGGKHKYTFKKGRYMIHKSRKRNRCSLFNKMCRYH